MASDSMVLRIHPLAGFSFGKKEGSVKKGSLTTGNLDRMKSNYMRDGIRRCVEGILLMKEYSHPHLLLLQEGNKILRLPGGHLKPGENEIEGLRRKLSSKLGSVSSSLQPDWQIGECVGVWWRPNFETIMYPYCPPQVKKPKECKKIYVVHLSGNEHFEIPKNMKPIIVPLFELFDNVERYGPEISSIPQQLSKFTFDLQ
eukprot:TRINITY_DN35231_c0_g1_i1.p1 TRINITY_DN35231_c0_g1~~TRINITY_DN35231_c0_g1_i1.p1  ORF type:complete len:200 (+),score=45.78 TRINITY_DN35231_c0_g1_i1:148-747(+)